jgi:hypothetical protein
VFPSIGRFDIAKRIGAMVFDSSPNILALPTPQRLSIVSDRPASPPLGFFLASRRARLSILCGYLQESMPGDYYSSVCGAPRVARSVFPQLTVTLPAARHAVRRVRELKLASHVLALRIDKIGNDTVGVVSGKVSSGFPIIPASKAPTFAGYASMEAVHPRKR